MSMKYPKGMVKHLSTPVSAKVHGKLVALARNREMPQGLFFRRVLEWVSTKTVIELLQLGVNLTVFAGDDYTPVERVEMPE